MLRVPLVRVEGKQYSVHPLLTMTPERFARAAHLEREARDEVARAAETEYEFEPSLYFYAGVAHPSFGDVVLAYHPESSTTLAGNATTFDSGGMYLGHIRGSGLSTPAERRLYVERDCCTLDVWQSRASIWIVDNFEALDDYFGPTGRPRSSDSADRLGHPDNERRAWTFEVRLYDDRELFENLAFAVVRQDFLMKALSLDSEKERLLDLLANQQLLQADDPCESAVLHIRDYVNREVAS